MTSALWKVIIPPLVSLLFVSSFLNFLDDIAIAEAVAQVENDLRPKESNSLGIGTFMVIFLGGIVTAKIISTIF